MIVIGVDPHKQTHTAAAVQADVGELLSEQTVRARQLGHEQLVTWARSLDDERLWALEDCRHVSVSLERFLLAAGERVLRVPPKLMAGARRGSRQRGKSDAIDALAIARAALREPQLPSARLAGAEREIRLLVDHREDLVAERTRIQQRLRWHLHELCPELELPAGCLDRRVWLERLARRLAHREQTVQVEICRELVGRCRELTRRAAEIERQLAALMRVQAAALLEVPGCGVLTAAKLVGETAGAERFSNEAKLAMHAGAAPLAASSGARRVTDSIAPATGSSTARCTASRSLKGVGTLRRASIWPARRARGTRARRRCAVSSATSLAWCTARCGRSRRRR